MQLGARVFHFVLSWTLIVFCALAAAPSTAQDAGPGSQTVTADDPLQALTDVLRDADARQRLLDALEATTGETAAPADATATAAEAPIDRTPSIGSQVAEITQGIAQGLVDRLDTVLASLASSGSVFDGLSGDEVGVLFQSLQSLFLVIVITLAVYLALRFAIRPVFRRLGDRARDANALRTGFIFVGSTLLDVGIVLTAWALGYAITLLALGDYAQIGFRQALYLNAFLLVEMVKVGIRAIVSPTTGGLRLINLSNAAAIRLNRHSNVLVSVLGYGQLLIVPIVNRNLSFAAGLGVSALLSVFVLFYLVVLVIRHRDDVANWIARQLVPPKGEDTVENDPEPTDASDRASRESDRLGGILGTLTRTWHWFMLVYLAVIFVAVVSQPTDVVTEYLLGSGKVLAAALIGSFLLGAIGRSLRSGVHLPEHTRLRLPLLEVRLNKIVPKVLGVLRLFVAFLLVAYTLDVIGLINFGGWIGSEAGLNLSGRAATVVVILAVASLLWLAMNAWIDYELNPDFGTVPSSRQTTLLTLLRNAATIALVILTLMFTLSEIGLDIGPLLASAGVLGLAIGFGSQKLVQDIITGIFIQFDNAMNVGDVVTVGSTTGVVEKLSVRSVALRDVSGTYHIVPFSSVDMVSNFMRDFAYFVCDMGIAYREDIEEAKQAMFDAFNELRDDPAQSPALLGDLEWFGLNAFGDSAIVLRARIKTKPGLQWGIGRTYNGILKRIFDERGIEIPFPHQTIFFGEAKDGRTQALRLKNETREDGAPAD